MRTTWQREVFERSAATLRDHANPDNAIAMQAYMKDVAPYLGIPSGERRTVLREAWRDLTPPSSDELGEASLLLFQEDERELHYAAEDLIAKFIALTDEWFLVEYVEPLLTFKPWWDTVDGLGSVAVSPLCWRYDANALVRKWSRSENLWLNRAAIQHQRGWRRDTDVAFVLELCAAHAHSSEFFVVKASGWALRDIARLDPASVRRFVRQHPELGSVGVREAKRGLGIL